MEIKIEIIFDNSPDDKSSSIYRRNLFEEVALFLDCSIIQNIIKEYREKIKLKELVSYAEFDKRKDNIPIQYELNKEQRLLLYELENDIDSLLNRTSEYLSYYEKDELERKTREMKKWHDPFFALSKTLEKELIKYKKADYLQILLMAIICGEVSEKDFTNITFTRKGARKVISLDREAYWLHKENANIGYGTVGKKQGGVLLRTTASRIRAYKQKLVNYEISLRTSAL